MDFFQLEEEVCQGRENPDNEGSSSHLQPQQPSSSRKGKRVDEDLMEYKYNIDRVRSSAVLRERDYTLFFNRMLLARETEKGGIPNCQVFARP